MTIDYNKLFTENRPVQVEMPIGLKSEAKYVFSITYTDPHTLDAPTMSEVMKDAMLRDAQDLAPYPNPQGHLGLREYIVQNLKSERNINTSVDSVFLTSGAGGAVRCILDAFISPGDVVFVEEFCYLGTMRMLLQLGTNIIHVPTDEQGMCTNVLESKIKELDARGVQPKMIYSISVYQNPTGVNLSLARRAHMLEISHTYGIPILENESYSNFRISGDPLPPSMFGMDSNKDAVMYVSAFTKLIGCGLRLGYGIVPESVKDVLAEGSFGGSPSHLSAMLVHEYLRTHMDDHVQAVRGSLKAKRDAMLGALEENFPSTCTWNKPDGGMMIWVRLPEGADTWSALEKAVEVGVKYNPGGVFRANRDRNNYLRLTYSYNSPDEIWEGIGILAEVFRREGLFS